MFFSAFSLILDLLSPRIHSPHTHTQHFVSRLFSSFLQFSFFAIMMILHSLVALMRQVQWSAFYKHCVIAVYIHLIVCCTFHFLVLIYFSFSPTITSKQNMRGGSTLVTLREKTPKSFIARRLLIFFHNLLIETISDHCQFEPFFQPSNVYGK